MARAPKATKDDRLVPPEDGQAKSRTRRLIPVFVAVVTVSAFSAGVWYAYDQGVKQGIRVKPPLIKAEPGPTKVVPENPGGLQVPNQDKQVFERITAAPPEPTVEKLLPPQETPLPEKPEPLLPPEPAGNAQPEEQAAAPAPDAPEAPSQAQPDVQTQSAPAVTEPPAAPPQAAPEPQTEPVPGPAPGPATASNAGAIRIQLAAFREETIAHAGWEKLVKKHTDVLADLKPTVVRVDLGPGKGIYYRLQAGPFTDKAAAEAVCVKLKAQKQPCLVVTSGN